MVLRGTPGQFLETALGDTLRASAHGATNSLSRNLTANVGSHNALSNTPRCSSIKGAALSTTLLDPLQQPGTCNWAALAMRTKETHYDVQITLGAQGTTRFKRHPPSQGQNGNPSLQRRTPEPQGRWFCARSFQTAAGSRLKDAEASEGLA